MWEFMSNYAESFWRTGEYAFEVFSVIMAWGITCGCAYFVVWIISAVGEMIVDRIRESKKGDNDNGKKG